MATATSLNASFNKETNAVHVRYKSLYISLPSSAEQEREMTKFGPQVLRCLENVSPRRLVS